MTASYRVVKRELNLVVELDEADELVRYSDDMFTGYLRAECMNISMSGDETAVMVLGPVIDKDGEPWNPPWSPEDQYSGLVGFYLPRQKHEMPARLLEIVQEVTA